MRHLGAEWRKLSVQQQEAYKAKVILRHIMMNLTKENQNHKKSSKNRKSRSKGTAKKTHKKSPNRKTTH
jgi:hypothetical protein